MFRRRQSEAREPRGEATQTRAACEASSSHPHDFLLLAPDELSLIEGTVEHLADCGRSPSIGVTRGLPTLSVERLGDPGQPHTTGTHLKN
jgi:hypothetical protein